MHKALNTVPGKSLKVWSLFFLIFSCHIFMSITMLTKLSKDRDLVSFVSHFTVWQVTDSGKVINIYWIIKCRKSLWSHMVNILSLLPPASLLYSLLRHRTPNFKIFFFILLSIPTMTCNSGCSSSGCLSLLLDFVYFSPAYGQVLHIHARRSYTKWIDRGGKTGILGWV